MVDPFDTILIIVLRILFKLVCDTKTIHEDAAMGILYFLVRMQAVAAQKSKIAIRYNFSRKHQKE